MGDLKDKRGVMLTQALFVETSDGTFEPSYTLKQEDFKGYPSMYRLYMECTDEYEAAIKLVGSMRHWRKLCNLKWFVEGREQFGHEGLNKWREDMRLRDESLARRILIEQANEGNVTAARSLIGNKTPKRKTKTKGGKDEYDDDITRLNLI